MAKMKDRVKLAFYNQRNTSKQREIEFKFSFEEWVTWWETQLGPNWFALRGARRGEYCMARRGDKGPYAPYNVMCVTARENALERTAKQTGENHPNAKLTVEEVRYIRKSKLPHVVLARQLSVHRLTIYRIRSRKLWTDV